MRRDFLKFLCVAVAAPATLFLAKPAEASRAPLPPGLKIDRILIQKRRHRMVLYAANRRVRVYSVALGRGGLGPKIRQGDGKTPEGFYRIDGRNPDSRFHLALHLDYPNADDVLAAAERGEEPGGDIMIHGLPNGFVWLSDFRRLPDWTAGCIAVTDAEIEEIWDLVPDGTPVEIRA
jgi:murein L,D-transpeptidase YafK